MLKGFKLIFLLVVFTVVLSTSTYAQETIKIDKKLLTQLLEKSDTHLLLKSVNGSIYALDSNRNTIYPAGYKAPDNEIYYVFEVSNLRQLLQSQNQAKIVTDPVINLETTELPWCPPHCPNN